MITIGITLLTVAVTGFIFGIAIVTVIKKLRNYQIKKENDNEIY